MSNKPVTAPDGVERFMAALVGAPVRVTALDAQSGERRFRLHGILASTLGSGIQIDLVQAPPQPIFEGTFVAVEVLGHHEHYWFHTRLGSTERTPGTRLRVHVPDTLEMSQRRRYPRIDLDVPIHLVIKATGQVVPAQLRDLSAGGSAIWVEEPIPVGEPVSLIGSLGSGMYLHDLQAEILRCSALPDQWWVLAVQFRSTPEQQAALATWVSERLAVPEASGE